MKDMISVIVPVYNVEKYLNKCVESIIGQTYCNMEIILVDDGSTDNSGKLCDDWKLKDNRIRVIHKKNGGLSDARNAGMNAAQGEYIGFVDSDDYIHPKMYELLINEIKNNNADISICREYSFYENNEPVYGEVNENYEVIVETRKEVIEHFLDASEPPFTYAWNKLYRRKLIEEKRFLVGKKMEDLIFLSEIAGKINRGVWVNVKLYYYRQRKGSIMHSGQKGIALDYGEAILFEYKCVKKQLDRDFESALLCKCLNRLAINWLRTIKYGEKSEIEEARNFFEFLYDAEATNIKDLKEKMKLLVIRYIPLIYKLVYKV